MCRPAPRNYAVDEMAGRKIERMVLESRSTSEQFACRSPLLLSASVIRERSHDRYERNFLFSFLFFFFFFFRSILYRKLSVIEGSVSLSEFSERRRIGLYSNNRIFSKQDSSGVDRVVLNIQALISLSPDLPLPHQCIIPPRD